MNLFIWFLKLILYERTISRVSRLTVLVAKAVKLCLPISNKHPCFPVENILPASQKLVVLLWNSFEGRLQFVAIDSVRKVYC